MNSDLEDLITSTSSINKSNSDNALIFPLPHSTKLEIIINNEIKKNNSNFKTVGQPLRIALTGSRFGPGIYDILTSLGKDEVIKRLAQIR